MKLIFKCKILYAPILLIAFILSSINYANCQEKTPILFEVLNLKKEIKGKDDISIGFKITNKSFKKILIPNVITYNIITNKDPNLDIGYEVCEVNNDLCNLNDSCYSLLQPNIPEEGYQLKSYKKNVPFYYYSYLPYGCFYKKGEYKIRFTYFPKNRKINKIQTQWYSLKVINDLL